jgi:hypothetical protein
MVGMQGLDIYVKPQLPPKLIENVVGYLHDRPLDLRKCALLSRVWVVPSRFHLFHTISIYQVSAPSMLAVSDCAMP